MCRTRVRRNGPQRRAGDAAARASDRVPPRRATWIPRDFRRRKPTRLRLEMIRPESGRLGPKSAISAETTNSGRNSKKKKKRCKTHRLT